MNTLAYVCAWPLFGPYSESPGLVPNPAAHEQMLLWMVVGTVLMGVVIVRTVGRRASRAMA
ncbi:MAG TPA: hypothetical protein PKE29_13715 [Phycisphaerales bacterium]|nr:hypothetical protein [Phycisphaerales bacterium]